MRKLHVLVVVVALLIFMAMLPGEGAVLLYEEDMILVQGGCANGMCADERDCLDTARASCDDKEDGATCSYKSGPGQEDYCKESDNDPPDMCALTNHPDILCGTTFKNGQCLNGVCQNAKDSHERVRADIRTDFSDDC